MSDTPQKKTLWRRFMETWPLILMITTVPLLLVLNWLDGVLTDGTQSNNIRANTHTLSQMQRDIDAIQRDVEAILEKLEPPVR